MTKLLKPISRESAKLVGRLPVIVTIAPCGGQAEARIGLRLKSRRTSYTATVSDLYRVLAMWHGQKEAQAKREARRNGIPWKRAKKQFEQLNRL